jgi:hypothetical protein
MVEWANQNNGFVMAVLTLVYVVATLVLVGITTRANRIALNAQKLQEQLELQRSRPYVVVDFELVWDRNDLALVYLTVKNLGQTMAQDVAIDIEPTPFHEPLIDGIKARKVPFMLTDGIPTIAPRQEFSDNMGFSAELYRTFDKAIFKGRISYNNPLGHLFEEKFVVDWESMKDSVPLKRRREQ